MLVSPLRTDPVIVCLLEDRNNVRNILITIKFVSNKIITGFYWSYGEEEMGYTFLCPVRTIVLN